MKLKLKYLYRDRDRHGNERFYVVVPGRKKVRIREEPGTGSFMEAYTRAIDGADFSRKTETAPGSFDALIRAYTASKEFSRLSPRTQYVRRLTLQRAADLEWNGRRDGEKPVGSLRPHHIKARRDAMDDRPEAANGYVKTLRQIFKWAIAERRLQANPANEVPYLKTVSGGFHTWTVEEVRQFAKRHPIGTKAYLALALLLWTGARVSDARHMGPQMERGGRLIFVEQKGSSRLRKERSISIAPQLREAIDAYSGDQLVYLTTEFGKPFSEKGLSNWFKKRCVEAGLPHCSAHGLRKAGATIIAERGGTSKQLQAAYEWTTSKMADHYTRAADQARLADRAFELLVIDELEEGGDTP